MKKSNKYVFDIEVFPNYFCIVLKKLNDDKILRTENNEYSFANISNALKRLYSPK